jgi:copper chaperone CopZ
MATLGSVLSAVASSACCWLPLALVSVGLSAAGIATFFERFRVLFLVVAALLLIVSFYLNYIRKERRGPDDVCARPNPRRRRFNRGMLWISTALVLTFAFFPGYVGLLLATTSAEEHAALTETWTLTIEGMTCAGCEATATTALSGVPGVLDARASHHRGTATIVIEAGSPPSQPTLSWAIDKIGYTLIGLNGSRSSLKSFTGHWIASSETEDGQEFEIVLDLAQIDSRWVGEFDLPSFGIEDYRVDVAVSDSLIELHFTAIAVDFRGTHSGGSDRLPGRAIQRGEDEDWELVFERRGGADFSPLFLELEVAGSDTSAVQSLSSDARELRAAFNRDSKNEGYPAISPDECWIAYFSDESGQYNVNVRPFPNVDSGKWLISTRGGVYPIWAPDGRELYYFRAARSGDPWGVMVVAIETEPAFAAGNPEVLFCGEYLMASSIVSPYDISPDGRRFLMIKEDSQAREAAEAVVAPPTTELIVVENWDEMLKGITPNPVAN